MSNIRNYISLTDRMTPTLRSILKAMDSMLKVMEDLDKAANKGTQSKAYQRAEKDLQRANNQLIKMSNYNQLVSRTARDGERAYRRMGSAVNSVANGVRSIGSASTSFVQSLAAGVYLAQKLVSSVDKVMDLADTSRSQVARLGLYNTSSYSNEALYGHVFRTAMGTRTSLTETADLANRILISGVYSGETSTLAAIETAGLINKALVAGGSTADENQRALRQLTQGLASGVLQGDELRSIREQAPYFAQVLAEGLSKVDERFEGIGIGDLKRLGAEGELTADRVIKALWAMQDEINEDFKAMPKTFGQAMTSLLNIWQYFLWMISDTEGPLSRINDLIWQFVDYLQTPQGFELLNAVATVMDVLSRALVSVANGVGNFVVLLQENVAIAQALFFALGTAAVIAGVSAAAAWVAATWPILLIIAAVGVLVYAFLNAGYTIQQIVGAVAGFILAALATLWDTLLAFISLIMVVLQIGAYVGWTMIMIIYLIGTIWNTVVTGAVMAFWYGLAAILGYFYSFYSDVAGIILSIAELIDSVFGTGLYDAAYNVHSNISGWFEGTIDTLASKGDVKKEEIDKMWEQFAEVGVGGYSAITEAGNAGQDFLGGYLVDPSAAYNAGNEWGIGLVDGVGDFSLGLPGNSVFGSSFNTDGVTVDGGYLDGIKSDVNISDEDVQLLRDMAARDVLLQLQSITPVAHVTFGDVRETADVNKIMEVIETMVEEQMATALVS